MQRDCQDDRYKVYHCPASGDCLTIGAADTGHHSRRPNDYGFENTFARQIEALCAPGDVVVGISTSGQSTNVITGIEKTRSIGATTIGFTGGDGGRLAGLVDTALVTPDSNVSRIQECHILIGHIICDWVEAELAAPVS